MPVVRGCADPTLFRTNRRGPRFGIGPELLKIKREATHDQSLALLRASMLSRLVGYGSDFAAKHTAPTVTTTAAAYSATTYTGATTTPSTTGAAKRRSGTATLFVSRWRL